MKICFYAISTHLGGAERSLVELVEGLSKVSQAGIQPWVLLPKEGGPLIDVLKTKGIAFDVLPMPPRFLRLSRQTPLRSILDGLLSLAAMPGYFARLTQLIRSQRPALIHSTGIKCHLITGLLGSMLGAPTLWHLRDIFYPGLTRLALQCLRLQPEIHWIANSTATARSFIANSGPERVVYNGLDPQIFFPKPNKFFHQKFALPPETPLIGIVGAVARWKGQLEFIQMAELLKNSAAHFVIIGDAIYDTAGDSGFMEQLKAEASKPELKGRVHFAGFVRDSALAINSLDVLVHASTRPEPFGRVVLEGMACGVPVCASRDGGVLEMIEDQKNGVLFEPGNIEAMAQAVDIVLSDPKQRARLIENARKTFEQNFTRERHVTRMIEWIQQVLAPRPHE